MCSARIHYYIKRQVHVKSKYVKYNKKGNPFSDFTLFSSTPFISSAFNVSTFMLSNIQTQSNILHSKYRKKMGWQTKRKCS